MFIELTTWGTRPADQQTAALMSTYVGVREQSRMSGWPSLVSATAPWPWMSVLNIPPLIIPAPLTRCTS